MTKQSYLILFLLLAISSNCHSKDFFGSVGEIYFDVYQNMVSPTKSSVSNCQFIPSCSQYAKVAIDEHGVIVGMTMFGDRFQRCSGGIAERNQYPVVNGLYFDPPNSNELFGDQHLWKAGIYTYKNKFKPISKVTTSNDLSFAYSLFKEEDYNSSILELKRTLNINGDSLRITPLLLSNYLLSNDKHKAMQLVLKMNNSKLFSQDIFILSNVTNDLTELYRWNLNYIRANKSKLNNDELADKFMMYNHLRLNEYDEAEEIANANNISVSNKIDDLESNSKSPILAASLSTILPGSGYMYCGEVKEGLSALVINGLLGYSIYSLFKNENYSSGALVSLISFPFYFGNIVGSANMAETINKQYREQKFNEIRNDFEIAFYFSFNYFDSLWQE